MHYFYKQTKNAIACIDIVIIKEKEMVVGLRQKIEINYIIRKSEIEEMEALAKTHLINKNVQRINKSLGDIVGLKNLVEFY